MNFDTPISENEVEPLICAALAADSRAVDVSRVAVEILARFAEGRYAHGEPEFGEPSIAPQPTASPSVAPLPLWKRSGVHSAARWGLALAACLIAAVGLGEWFIFSATPASAYSLVESAHSVLLKSPRDRCYQVEMALPIGWLSKSSFLHAGDRKFV
ncbi:MAG TPA: hypothetical protein VGJ26_02925, partial [Pirellulales bacterium]